MDAVIAKEIREWAQFAILVFATGFGIYRFVYQDIYVPSRRTATLTVESCLEEFGRAAGSILIRAKIHAVNRSEKTVYVPALWYTVWGLRFTPQDGELTGYRSLMERQPTEFNPRYSALSVADVVAVGTILTRLTDFYHPADETTNEIVFGVPADLYEAVELRVHFFVTKDTRGLAPPAWEVGERGDLDTQITLMGRRYDPENDRSHGKWARKTGAGFNWSMSTLPLLSPAPPPSPEVSCGAVQG